VAWQEAVIDGKIARVYYHTVVDDSTIILATWLIEVHKAGPLAIGNDASWVVDYDTFVLKSTEGLACIDVGDEPTVNDGAWAVFEGRGTDVAKARACPKVGDVPVVSDSTWAGKITTVNKDAKVISYFATGFVGDYAWAVRATTVDKGVASTVVRYGTRVGDGSWAFTNAAIDDSTTIILDYVAGVDDSTRATVDTTIHNSASKDVDGSAVCKIARTIGTSSNVEVAAIV
jgi:hypothetical protein